MIRIRVALAFSALFLFAFTQPAFGQHPGEKFISAGITTEVRQYPATGPFVGISFPLSDRQIVRGSFTVTTSRYSEKGEDTNISNEAQYDFLINQHLATVAGIKASRETEISHIPRQFFHGIFGARVIIPTMPQKWACDVEAVQSTSHHDHSFKKLSSVLRRTLGEGNSGLYIPVSWERGKSTHPAYTDPYGRRHPSGSRTNNAFSVGIGFWWGFGSSSN